MMNTNNDLKLSSLELCKNSKEEVGPDRSVSSNKFSSVTLNKLAMNRQVGFLKKKPMKRSAAV